MSTHKVVIAGTTYGNVGSIEPDRVVEYYHNVTALSGKQYKDIRYTKTNYTLTFFNLMNGVYESLVSAVKYFEANNSKVTCGIPIGEDTYEYKQYYLSIAEPSKMKGYHRGTYYKTGLKVLLEAVEADG